MFALREAKREAREAQRVRREELKAEAEAEADSARCHAAAHNSAGDPWANAQDDDSFTIAMMLRALSVEFEVGIAFRMVATASCPC